MLFYLRGFLHLKIKNLILESMSLWNITCAPSNAQKMLPVLFILLFITALFHQDWKKKYFLCTKSPSRYQAETEILKITSQGGMHIFYIYIPLQACISQQLPTSQTDDVVPPVAKTPASGHSSTEEGCLRPRETEQGFSTAAQKSPHHGLILTWPLTHITLALPPRGQVDENSAENQPLELQSKTTHTRMLPQYHCQNIYFYLFILSKKRYCSIWCRHAQTRTPCI